MDNQLILTNAYINGHTLDAARVLEDMEYSEQIALLHLLTSAVSARILEITDPFLTVELISSLPAAEGGDILDKFPVDKAVLILNKMEPEMRKKIIEALPGARAADIVQMMTYPPDSAGALMDPRVLTLPEDIHVKEARHRLTGNAGHVIYYVYVLDRSNKLKGLINIRDLFIAGEKEVLSTIYKTCSWVLRPFQRAAQILRNPGWQEMHALPVIDEQSVFLGAIGYRTLKSIELQDKRRKKEHAVQDVGTALGELYWLGVSGLLRGFYTGFSETKK